ncbi:MAG: DUF2092 domain-containing protein [Limisphaerales bacterium]
MKRVIVISCGLTLAPLIAAAAQTETKIAPQAERVLSAACQYLAEAPQFSLNAEVWREHVTESGQKVQFCRTVSIEVKRPNRLHVEITSPHSQRGFWYDGKTLTILDRQRNYFSVVPMPGKLDAALDKASEEFGIDLPLIDLAVSDPYKNAVAKVQTGTYYGLSPALGMNCHHLAFTQENIDWQVWVQDGPQPFIRKMVITHKAEEGAPEFTGLITRWDLTQRIAESDFVFEPPPGAKQIELRPVRATTSGAGRQTQSPKTDGTTKSK